ncbi:MAG: MOSC N-terminal beta barrel domain-containing protein [Polyangiaceae bacterium]
MHAPVSTVEPTAAGTQASVSGLYVYPVKSCRGIRVDSVQVAERGFADDRRWMIVDDAGQFITQRQVTELCLVDTALDDDAIRLSAPGAGSVLLPRAHEQGDELQVTVWRHTGLAVRHTEGSAWISQVLGRASSLVYMADRHERPVNPTHARPGDKVSYADGYPFLVISEASLADLNARLEQPLGMERFRPNITVRGVAPYAEDEWTHVRMGELAFRAVKRCSRCTITTIDPLTATKSKEPLRTLARYRRWDNEVWFGMNLIADGTGQLALGDRVTLTAPGASHG